MMTRIMKKIIFPVTVVMLYLSLQQCKHKPVYPIRDVCFESEVLPIFISNCSMSGCHGNGSAAEGLVLDNYNSILAGVNPGNPEKSEIYQSITGGGEEGIMPPPPKSPLTQEQISTIYNWILAGAKNTTNCASETCDTANVTYSNQITTIMSNYCVGCHNAGNASGGWDLSNYNGIVACINAGRFWGSVNWDTGFSPMPKNGNQLSACDLRTIKIWLDNGNPNN